MQSKPSYPLQLDIDYPEGPRNRLTVGLRIFTIIPIAIVVLIILVIVRMNRRPPATASGA